MPPGPPRNLSGLHPILDVLHPVGFLGGGTVVGLSQLSEQVGVHLGGAEHGGG